jgi:hypothetical protein
MEPDAQLAKVLDECLARINEGKPIDVCVAASPRLHDEVAPLLYTGHYISTQPKIEPSEEFRRTAKERLMARLQEEEKQAANIKVQTRHASSFLQEFNSAMHRAWQAVIGAKRIALPVAIGLILVIVSAFSINNFMSPSPALADGCTLSIISGTVEISGQAAGSQSGTDGMTLDVGTRVKTAPDSSALLTFFDGSTVELKSGTEIEITRLESNDGKAVTIVLKQWVGRTWSTVVKMVDKGSRYEIETPSAVALVRGTQFVIDVDDTGRTQEHTTQGLVSVSAHGEEVLVPPGKATTVEINNPPSEPADAPEPEDAPQEKSHQQQDSSGSDKTLPEVYGQVINNSSDTGSVNSQGNAGIDNIGQGQDNSGGQGNGNTDGTIEDNNTENDQDGSDSQDQDNNNSQNNGNSNSGGNGNGNANGNDNSNSGGNANGNSYGNGNSGGNANGNSNGGDNGNSGSNGNANGGDSGNTNGSDNSNSGGNDNGNTNGSDNNNSGSNGNANGSDNGNSGGGGNGNSNGGDNNNSGSNGNANGSDSGNTNGNDNGNANGGDNSNTGGNDNGNGNGNGKDK